jgi:hypothetical protein
VPLSTKTSFYDPLYFLVLGSMLTLSPIVLIAQTNSQLLTSAPWHFKGMGIDYEGDGTLEKDLWKACRIGSTLTFSADGKGANFKGASPCNMKPPATIGFTWSINPDGSLQYTEGGKTEATTIKNISATTLTLYFPKSHVLFKLERP